MIANGRTGAGARLLSMLKGVEATTSANVTARDTMRRQKRNHHVPSKPVGSSAAA